MFVRTKGLKSSASFPFPFPPYAIQEEFMRALYSVIENRKIGIFESPTGTGKTLTLMCSTLKWLNDHDQLNRVDLREQIIALQTEIADGERTNATATDWLDGQFDALQKKGELVKMKKLLEAMEAHDRIVIEMRSKWQQQQQKSAAGRRAFAKRRKSVEDLLEVVDEDGMKTDGSGGSGDGDDEFAIDDSDDDDTATEPDPEDEEKRYHDSKILFCSRTHSQLAQVVNELKKTVYGKSVRVVSLASRQQYCINESVRALKTNALINERCLELKKGKSKSKCCVAQEKQRDQDGRAAKKSRTVKTKVESCPFYGQTAIDSVKQTALYHANGVLDIEELIEEAKQEKGCPYYASRQAAKDAQVIMLPYQMLLHKKTRDQLDINISNSVIIIDEAHNLLDTIASIHSAEITLNQMQQSHRQLVAYKAKYLTRFSTKNLLRLNQLISIANRFVRFLAEPNASKSNDSRTEFTSQLIFLHDLLDEVNISVSNLFEVLTFCENTRLAQKVGGFALRYANDASVVIKKEEPKPKQTPSTYLKRLAEKQQMQKSKTAPTPAAVNTPTTETAVENAPVLGSASVLRILLAFLECLLEKSTDGRILISRHRTLQSKSVLKYLLLNPSGPFDELLRECRALIVAGGTMQPTVEFKSQLFGEFSRRIEEHFFGHVVAAEAVLPMVVAKGPRASPFLFNFNNRNNSDMLADLSMVLQNICKVVPAGIVCFFTSYDYMDQFYKYLCDSNALPKIQTKKKVFKESRAGGQTEKMLTDYATAIRNCRKSMVADGPTGALMLSVIGGKLSEGLNFSDDLGRCVCVVGLPFPNRTNPELAEKMKYLDEMAAKQKQNDVQTVSYSSTEYYENLCMKAVNQCIGRAIRHINDYATVLLIDERYGSARIQQKLPEWIRKSLKCPPNFGGVQGALVKFFREKNKTKSPHK